MGTMIDRKNRELTKEDIETIANTYASYEQGELANIKGFCSVADIQEIAKHDYILTPGRYVGIEDQEEDAEPFNDKMQRLTAELSSLFTKSDELQENIKNNLAKLGYPI